MRHACAFVLLLVGSSFSVCQDSRESEFGTALRKAVQAALKGNDFEDLRKPGEAASDSFEASITVPGFERCDVGADSAAQASLHKKMFDCAKGFDNEADAIVFYTSLVGNLNEAIGKGQLLPPSDKGKWKQAKLKKNIVVAAFGGKAQGECYGREKNNFLIQVYEGHEFRFGPSRFAAVLQIHDLSAQLAGCN